MEQTDIISGIVGSLMATTAAVGDLPPLPQGGFQIGPECTENAAEGWINIEGRDVFFYESTCEMVEGATLEGIEGAAYYVATCSGEGETWRESFVIAPSWDDGVIILRNRLSVTYARCSDPQVAEPVHSK